MTVDDPVLDVLQHFGVKGMKWGVRKDRSGDSTESRSERKQARIAAENYFFNAIGGEPLFRYMTEEEYKTLSTKGRSFAEQTTLRRVSMSPSTQLKGRTYVSKTLDDALFYRAILPAVGPNAATQRLGAKRYKDESYELTLKTTARLTSPSPRARVDAFIELMDKPVVRVEPGKPPVTGRAYLEAHGYKSWFKKYDNRQLAFKAWYDMVGAQGNQDDPLVDAYFKSLKRKGYDFIPDDYDKGKFTKDPVIILDPKKAKVIDVKRLTTDDINKAQRELGNKVSPGSQRRWKWNGTRWVSEASPGA